MRTKIVSAFPGTGKTFYHQNNSKTSLDSDSIDYSWLCNDDGTRTNVRNPAFPQNYIDHIKENIGKYEHIFVSSHKEVREALLNNCLFFYLVYPSKSEKSFYMKKYEDRGSNPAFIKLIGDNWDARLNEVDESASNEESIYKYELDYRETISDFTEWV